jgi:hypothetical protein
MSNGASMMQRYKAFVFVSVPSGRLPDGLKTRPLEDSCFHIPHPAENERKKRKWQVSAIRHFLFCFYFLIEFWKIASACLAFSSAMRSLSAALISAASARAIASLALIKASSAAALAVWASWDAWSAFVLIAICRASASRMSLLVAQPPMTKSSADITNIIDNPFFIVQDLHFEFFFVDIP